jgi:hypothetical protein
MSIFVTILLIVALLIDVISLVLEIHRILKGSGPSGLPVISLFVYYLLTEWMNQSFIFRTPLRAILALAVFHIFCQYLMPLIFRLGVKLNRQWHLRQGDGRMK